MDIYFRVADLFGRTLLVTVLPDKLVLGVNTNRLGAFNDKK
jgi:hypothetical protein